MSKKINSNNLKFFYLFLLLISNQAPNAQGNFFTSLQDKRLSEITLLSAHNATSNTSKGPNLVADQTLTLEQLLQEGVRALKVPIHIGIFWDMDVSPRISIKQRERAVVAHALSPLDALNRKAEIFALLFTSPAIQTLRKLPGFSSVFERAFNTIINRATDDASVILSKLSWRIDRTAMPLDEFLVRLRIFLENNPEEIVLVTPNINIASTKDFDHIVNAFEQSRILDYLFTHEPGKPWPTIKELIASDSRFIVMFQHADEHNNEIIKRYGPNHFMSKIAETSLLSFNTQYDYKNLEELRTKKCCIFGNSCRTPEGVPHFMTMQHFITEGLAGSKSKAREANKSTQIWRHITNCATTTGMLPNAIMLDFLTPESIRTIRQNVLTPLNTNRTHYQKMLLPSTISASPCLRCD